MNELLTYVIMSGTLIVVYIQYVIMLIELEKVPNQELNCLYALQDYHSPIRMKHTQNYRREFLNFYFIRNKHTDCVEMYVYCIDICTYCIYSIYILHRSACPLLA